MTTDDRPRFAEGIGLLSSMLPPRKVLSDAMLEGYWWALKDDLDLAAFTSAVRTAMKTCRFLPTPAELLALVSGTVQDRATVAWGDVVRQVGRVGSLGSPKLADEAVSAIRTVWGSWAQLARTLAAPGEPDHDWARKRFEAAYAAIGRDGGRGLLTPATVHPSVQALIDRPAQDRGGGFTRLVPKGDA